MYISGWWIVGLIVWLFMLQSRIKSLEELVNTLKKGLFDLETERYDKGAIASLKQHEERIREPKEDTDKVVIAEEKKVQAPNKKVLEDSGYHDIGLKQYQEASKHHSAIAKTTATTHHEYQIPEPVEPSKSTEPAWMMQILTSYFTGGNILVRIGGVILFFGLAFLLKYAAEHSTISIEMRLWSVATVAVGLVVAGWRLRQREGAYGQILQGLGVAVLYLAIYGASKFYTLLSLELAFVLMLVVVILGSLLALRQSSLPLALFSTGGGFLVPVLTSTGEGSHVVLFSYYLLLNFGIFFMAWREAWRVLNLVGFVFTFIIATGWGVLRYAPEMFATTEPFLLLYFLMYLAILILFAKKGANNLVDSTLLFGLPAVVFPLQVVLTSHIYHGAAYSAVVLGLLYLLLFKVLRGKSHMELIAPSFLGLGVLFLTIAVPYFFDADVTAALWAMESSAVIWLSLKQSRRLPRYLGEVLLLGSLLLYLAEMLSARGLLIAEYLGYIVVMVSLFVTAVILHRAKKILDYDTYMPEVMLLLSVGVWFVSGFELTSMYFHYAIGHEMTLVAIVGSVLLYYAYRYLRWERVRQILQATLPLGVISFVSVLSRGHFFEGIGMFVFVLLSGWSYYLLYVYQEAWRIDKILHLLGAWFIAAVCTHELHYYLMEESSSVALRYFVLTAIPLLLLYVFTARHIFVGWLRPYRRLYGLVGAGLFVPYLLFWEVLGWRWVSTDGLYIPLLNLLDSMQIITIAMIYYWGLRHRRYLGTMILRWFYILLFVAFMLLISVIYARAMHHYMQIPYNLLSLWGDYYFQMGIVLLWGMVSVIMARLSKRYINPLLPIGAGLVLLLPLLWELMAFGYSPDFLGSYIPLLNLLDLTQIGLLSMASYISLCHRKIVAIKIQKGIWSSLGFLWMLLVSVLFARGVHYYRDIPYVLSALWSDGYFQTGLSLLWSSVAIVLMLLSKRYVHRFMWIVGFGLLGVVVCKLFFVELANSGTVERIVSFMVVGTLLLLIGYFVPIPPGDVEGNTENGVKE
jgi:uncharacterized membrane protein